MNDIRWVHIRGSWGDFIGHLQERWGELTHEDIARIGGSHEQLITTIQERYGKTRLETELEVDDWVGSMVR